MAKILIADDDPAYLSAFCDGMDVMGHQATGVQNGADAIAALKAENFDIIFLDVFMRGGGAVVVLHDIRSFDASVPIVVITGKTEIAQSPLFSEGLRLAQARMRKTASLIELDQMVTRLTSQ